MLNRSPFNRDCQDIPFDRAEGDRSSVMLSMSKLGPKIIRMPVMSGRTIVFGTTPKGIKMTSGFIAFRSGALYAFNQPCSMYDIKQQCHAEPVEACFYVFFLILPFETCSG